VTPKAVKVVKISDKVAKQKLGIFWDFREFSGKSRLLYHPVRLWRCVPASQLIEKIRRGGTGRNNKHLFTQPCKANRSIEEAKQSIKKQLQKHIFSQDCSAVYDRPASQCVYLCRRKLFTKYIQNSVILVLK